jgi:hypothetical protein
MKQIHMKVIDQNVHVKLQTSERSDCGMLNTSIKDNRVLALYTKTYNKGMSVMLANKAEKRH